MARTLRTLSAAAALAALSACTMHEQPDAPALSGPSGNATSLTVNVSPDVLTQDGQSQSLVSIAAFGPNGQPLPNVPLRAEIIAGGVSTDFGTLSARNVVTDAGGHASVVYTAPPAPVFNNDNNTTVAISIAPSSTDFANNNPTQATIRLVPPGFVGPGTSPLRPDFTVPSATQGNDVVFQATVVDANNADATAQVTAFLWTFGDGGSASGRNVTHRFGSPGTFAVTLSITDLLGRTQKTTHSITVGQGALPTATFVVSPGSAVVGQMINFNASGSTAEPGHDIATYDWTFGDGTSGSGAIVQHSYQEAGSYTVTLQVKDDAGRKSSLMSQTITVTIGNPIPQITVSPPTGPVTTTFSFIGSQSTAAPGRTIVKYDWNFGDNTSGSGATTSHKYGTAGTYTVTLIVTDDKGNQGIATATVTVTS